MPPEIPRQRNMFTGEWDDNRTRRQKVLDQQRDQWHQLEMFSQRDIAQFGVNPHPLLPLASNTTLGLIFEDPRTDEEIERDRQRAAEAQTYQMFVPPVQAIAPDTIVIDTKTLALVPRGVVALVVIQQTCRALIPLDLAC